MTPHMNRVDRDDTGVEREASVSALLRYVHAVRQYGVDTESALAALGLQQQDIQNSQRRLPAKTHERLMRELVSLSGDSLFGLKAGLIVQPDAWTVLGYILINSASVGDAMARVVSYEKLIGELGTSHIEPLDGQICMSWQAHLIDPLAKRHMVENVLASWFSFGQWVADSKHPPCKVLFEHALPDGVSKTDYEHVFGCPVYFDQPKSGIVVDEEILALPLRQPDAALLTALENHAQKQLLGLDANAQSWTGLVQVELRRQLQIGVINKSEVAARLDMSERTLQRYLRREGTHYQQILDELRQKQAMQYLADPEQSLTDIAQALGYIETASFFRKFKTWTGMTPGEYRDSLLSELNNGHDFIG